MTEAERVAEHLGEALDQLLAVVAITGGLGIGEPLTEALDAALVHDGDYQEARAGLRLALGGVAALVPGGTSHPSLLALEEACNATVAAAATVGWRLALRARPGAAR